MEFLKQNGIAALDNLFEYVEENLVLANDYVYELTCDLDVLGGD